NIEITNPKIAPGHRKTRNHGDAAFPNANGFVMTASIKHQVAQIKGRAGVTWIQADGRLQDGNFLESRGEAIICWLCRSLAECFQRACCIAGFLVQPSERIINEWQGAPTPVGKITRNRSCISQNGYGPIKQTTASIIVR